MVSFETIRDDISTETQQLQSGGTRVWYRLKLWNRYVCLPVLVALLLIPSFKTTVHLRSSTEGQLIHNITPCCNIVHGTMKPYIQGTLNSHLTTITKLLLHTTTFTQFLHCLSSTETGKTIILWRGTSILRQIFIHCTYVKDGQKQQHGLVGTEMSMPFAHVVFRTGSHVKRIIKSAQPLYVSLHSMWLLQLLDSLGDPGLNHLGDYDSSEDDDEDEDEDEDADAEAAQAKRDRLIIAQQHKTILKNLYMIQKHAWVRTTHSLTGGAPDVVDQDTEDVDLEIYARFGPMPVDEVAVDDNEGDEFAVNAAATDD
jgi:hypothetical protein